MQLYYNNKSITSIAYISVQYDKTKHVGIDNYFIKDNLDKVSG